MPKPIDITGQRFGRLVAIQPIGHDPRGAVLWLCQCDCGNPNTVACGILRSGVTRSCGCRQGDFHHGHAGIKNRHPLYNIWTVMRARCNNPKDKAYKWYGARGIKVCKRWDSFTNFIADVGERPPRHSLDRINNNGNYEPNNIRWALHKDQQKNKRQVQANAHWTAAFWTTKATVNQSSDPTQRTTPLP